MDLGNSNVIQFANLNNRPTRAANDASSSYQVYAKWTGSTSGWYINDVINGMTNDPQGGTHYWPTTGTVDFYSWAPATVTAATSTYPDLSITYTDLRRPYRRTEKCRVQRFFYRWNGKPPGKCDHGYD